MSKKIKYILNYILSTMFLLGVVALVVLATIDYRNRLISKVNIIIDYPEYKIMLSEEDMYKCIKHELEFIQNTKARFFEDSIIMKKLYLLEPLEKVNVSCGIKGELFINIKQKEPIANIWIDNENYFLMSDSTVISYPYYKGNPLPEFYFDAIYKNRKNLDHIYELVALADFLKDSSFIKSCIDSAMVCKEGIYLKTNRGEQKVLLGDINNLNEKSDKLSCFYNNITQDILDKYKVIKLNFKNQVVAVKK